VAGETALAFEPETPEPQGSSGRERVDVEAETDGPISHPRRPSADPRGRGRPAW
jgi:hypothetical protein